MNESTPECPGCGSPGASRVGRSCSSVSLFHGRALMCCRACELVFLGSQPTESELAAMNSRYWEVAQAYTPMSERVHEAQMLSRVEYLERHLGPLTGKKVLDVGAGYGMLNVAMRRRQHQVRFYPVEYDDGCHEQLVRNGATSVARDLADCREKDFDLAVLSHVLEHVRVPQQFLESVGERLAPDGRLFIEVPNQDHVHKPDIGTHLLFFSPGSLRSLLGRAGYSVEHLATVGSRITELARSARRDDGSAYRGLPRWSGRVRASRFYQLGSSLKDQLRAATVSIASLRADLQLASYGGDRQWIRCLALVSPTAGEPR